LYGENTEKREEEGGKEFSLLSTVIDTTKSPSIEIVPPVAEDSSLYSRGKKRGGTYCYSIAQELDCSR